MENRPGFLTASPSNRTPASQQTSPRRAPGSEPYSPSSSFPPSSPSYAHAPWDSPSPPDSPSSRQAWGGNVPAHQSSPGSEPPFKSARGYNVDPRSNYPEYPEGSRLSLASRGGSYAPCTTDAAFPGPLTPRSVDFAPHSPAHGLPAGIGGSKDRGAACAFSDTASVASYYRKRQMQHHAVFTEEAGGSNVRGPSVRREEAGGGSWREGVGMERKLQVDASRGDVYPRERGDLAHPTTSSAWNSFAGRDETTSCISSRSPRFLQKERIANKEDLPAAGMVTANWRVQEEQRKNLEAHGRRLRDGEELEQRRRADQGNCGRSTGRGARGGLEPSAAQEEIQSPSNFCGSPSNLNERAGHSTPRRQLFADAPRGQEREAPSPLPQSGVRCVPPLNLWQDTNSPFPRTQYPSMNDAEDASPASSAAYCELPKKRRSGGSVADSMYAESVVSQRSRRSGDSSFVPRCDDRSARVKQIEGLKSTGSVIPLSAETRSAVVRAESRAALGKNSHFSEGDPGAPGGGGDGGDLSEELPYPLNRMEGRKEVLRRIEGDRRRGAPRLLPQDVRWNSSAAGVLSSRSALHSPHSFGGAVSTPSASPAGGGETMTARDTMLRQHFGHPEAFECDESTSQLSARSAYRNQSSASSLADAQQVTKEHDERRRQAQRLNPMYSDLFGRATPDPRSETPTNSDRSRTEHSSCRVGISGGDTLDRERATLRRNQLEQSRTAYERFINAMQSDILGTTDPNTPNARLASAQNARTCLLRDKHQSQRRREQLQQAIDVGEGRLFHMKTDEEVALPSARLDDLQHHSAPGKTVELHLSGVAEDMTEEDIRRICTAGGGPGQEAAPTGSSSSAQHRSRGITTYEKTRRGPAGCVMRICLATDVLTSKCKGTGKILLRCREGNSGEEEVVQRLLAARLGVRRGQINVDPPRPAAPTPRSFHGCG